MSALYDFLRRHRDFFDGALFNLTRPISYLRLPLYSTVFRHAMSILRAGYWSAQIGEMGKGVRIESGVVIRGNAKNLYIGDHAYIDTAVQLEVEAPLRIGKYVHIANLAHIQSGAEVTLGDFCAVAAGCFIYASSNTYRSGDEGRKNVLLSMSAVAPPELQCVERAPVIIEEYAFLGLNSTVLPGVRIGRGAVIGAGSVVTRDIPPYTIATGIPAKPVRQRPFPNDEDKREG